MSKSSTMLRTRRRDNNVKPNRRLDRKSSRGMLYENEELRLKTININAEIERGQSDIKKLKRENEMLKKEIWCLRDEYEKLDKLLKEKEIEFSSSSTTGSSDSESCSSCSEESEEVETSQNLENVQKTNLKNLRAEFDHLSVVPEENSTENSDKTSNRISLPNDPWCNEKDILKADQSYPVYDNASKASTLPVQDKTPMQFFSPIKISKSFEDSLAGPAQASSSQKFMDNNYYWNRPQSFQTFKPYGPQNHHSNCPNGLAFAQGSSGGFHAKGIQNFGYFPSPVDSSPVKFEACPLGGDLPEVPPLNKESTDLIVKLDNKNFNLTPSQSTFSNGGNLEELLNDIETISQDILKITSSQKNLHQLAMETCQHISDNCHPADACHPMDHCHALDHCQSSHGGFTSTIETTTDYRSIGYIPKAKVESFDLSTESTDNSGGKPYKSELNVVLMPSAMPLIGFDKYRNIQRSCESMQHSLENLESASQQDLRIIPESIDSNLRVPASNLEPNLLMAPNNFCNERIPTPMPSPMPHVCVTPTSTPQVLPSLDLRAIPGNVTPTPGSFTPEVNPFFFGNLPQPQTPMLFNNDRFNPENGANKDQEKQSILTKSDKEICNSKSNLIDVTSSDHVSSENEENLKFKTSKPTDIVDEPQIPKNNSKVDLKKIESKTPKLSIRRKVSIHFKGKKEKAKEKEKAKGMDYKTPVTENPEFPRLDLSKIEEKNEGKHDAKSEETKERKDSKQEATKPKTPGPERKYGIFEKFSGDKDKKFFHQKTPSMESKRSTADVHLSEPKTPGGESKTGADKKNRIESQTSTDSKTDKEKEKPQSPEKKGSSVSPDRKHVHMRDDKNKHRKHSKKTDKLRQRRSTISNDRFHRERSFSVCTDRSNILDHRLGYGFSSGYLYDDFNQSDRERTNSISSCETIHRRKLSNMSNFPVNGKIPWCGCWGNGCL